MADLLVRGGTVVTPTGIAPADVLIEGGLIADVVPPGTAARAAEALDATGCIVMPGVIDAHVHFRTPGLTHKEDWEHGSAAAVAGGVTTVLDMPNTVPATATAQALAEKVATVRGRSRCHFGFYGALAADNLAHLEALARGGAIGFKVFLGETTASLPPPDDGQLLQAWRTAKALGLRTMVHAENAALLHMAATIVAAQGIRDLRAHGLSRPAVAEVEAIVRACLLAAEAGAGICIAHVSTAGGAAAVRRAKAEGADVRGETCPHYLLLTEDEAMGLGAIAKVNPPLRGEADRAALWAAVADGTIDQVGSDHAPHTREEKAAGTEDVRRAPSGFAGVQNTLPLLCGEPRLPLRRLVELLCEGPARNWGLWPRKGRVARGADADLAVVRMGVREGAGHGAAGGAGQARGAGDPGGAPAAGDRGAAGPGAGAAPAGGPRPAGGAGAGAGSVWPRQWGLHPDGPLVRLCAPRAEVVATVVGGRVAFAGGSVVGEPRGEWVRG